jgi:hypothetical protein
VYIATAPRPAGAAPSATFVDASARVLERVRLDRLSRSGPPGALRGIVHALWRGRRLGYRRIELYTDDPAAAAQMRGEQPVDADAIGLYLEARSLMHLYTSARISVGELPPRRLSARTPSGECTASR